MVMGMVLTVIPPIDPSIDAPTPIDPPMPMAASIAHACWVGVAGVGGAGGGGGRMRVFTAPQAMEGNTAQHLELSPC